jgi:hypothetical protein
MVRDLKRIPRSQAGTHTRCLRPCVIFSSRRSCFATRARQASSADDSPKVCPELWSQPRSNNDSTSRGRLSSHVPEQRNQQIIPTQDSSERGVRLCCVLVESLSVFARCKLGSLVESGLPVAGLPAGSWRSQNSLQPQRGGFACMDILQNLNPVACDDMKPEYVQEQAYFCPWCCGNQTRRSEHALRVAEKGMPPLPKSPQTPCSRDLSRRTIEHGKREDCVFVEYVLFFHHGQKRFVLEVSRCGVPGFHHDLVGEAGLLRRKTRSILEKPAEASSIRPNQAGTTYSRRVASHGEN